MRLKTNLVVGLVFVGLLGYVYLFEIKKREEDREAAEKSSLLLDIEEDDVAKLTIDKGDTVIVLESRADGWWLAEPVADLADDAAVGRLLRNLRESERERVIADSAALASAPDKAAQYQLQPPRLELTVDAKASAPAAPQSATIRYGADNPTDTYVYVQQAGDNPEIFTVRAWRFDNVDKGVFDLRDRRVLDFTQDEVRDIELGYVGERIAISRGDDDTVWHLSHPVEAAADAEVIDDFLRRLNSAKIARFVDEAPDEGALADHGFDRPMVTVALTVGDDRAEKRLTVSATGDVGDGGRVAMDASRTPVFQIDSLLVSQLQVTVSDLRDKEPMKFDKDSVTRIEFSGTHGAFVAEKDTADNWTIVQPLAVNAKTWVVNGFLSDVERLEVVDFVRDQVDDGGMKEFGLDEPVLRIDLFAGDGPILGMAAGGDRDQEIYVTRAAERSVYAIDRERVGDIDLKVEDVWDKRDEESKAEDAGSGPGTNAGGSNTD